MKTLWTQPYFKRLADLYSQKVRRIVAFCGAGASREIGLPNWDGLIEQLTDQFAATAHTAIGEALTEQYLKNLSETSNSWDKMKLLKEYLRGQFEPTVRAILQPPPDKVPTFHRRIWELDPAALFSLNLDGLAASSYANRKTGLNPNYYVGKEVYRSRNTIGGNRTLIVDLHGNIDNPHSWVLDRSDLDELLKSDGYVEFLRSVFSQSIVIFYGIGVSDISVSGQMEYFKKINFINGEYFLIKRAPEEGDAKLYDALPIQIIYTGDDVRANPV